MHKCNVDFYSEIKNILYKHCSILFKSTSRQAVSLYINALVYYASKQPYGFIDKVCLDFESFVEFENGGKIYE